MRVLMVTPEPPSAKARGGRPHATHAELIGLASRHEITLVTQAGGDPGDSDALDRWRRAGVDVHPIWWPPRRGMELWERRVQLATYWLTSGYPWRNILHRDPRMQHVLDQLLATKTYDLVLVEDNVMGMYRFETRSPMILTEHEVRRPRPVEWRAWLKRPGFHRALVSADWRRWPAYQRNTWRRFQRIQCFTAQDAAMATTIAPEISNRFRVNPFGIEMPPSFDISREQPGTLVFVGALSHTPNVDAALWLVEEIMPIMRRLQAGVRLTIVGQSPPPRVLELANDDIVVTGAVPKIDPFLEAASVVVAPMRIGGGMRTKVLEAMAYGKAVVTTDRGIWGLDLAGEEPPAAIANDATEFAEACVGLLRDLGRRRDLGGRARAFVAKHHSPAAHTSRLEQILNELRQVELGT